MSSNVIKRQYTSPATCDSCHFQLAGRPRVRRRLLDADSEQVDAELQLLSRELNDLFLPNASCSHTTDASPTSGWEPREKQAGVVRSVFTAE